MPILNHRDYRLSKARLNRIDRALADGSVNTGATEHLPPEAAEARRQTLVDERTRLANEIAEYEALQADRPAIGDQIDGQELGLLPILARITQKLSQRELADRLNLKEQQIQRYERDRYGSISLTRYQAILAALNVELQPRLRNVSPLTALPEVAGVELNPELLRDLRRRNWIELPRDVGRAEMQTALAEYVSQQFIHTASVSLNRRTASQKPIDVNLRLWTARILQIAASSRSNMRGKFDISDMSWLGKLVSLSTFPDGPARAVKLLREHGIICVVEPHLPKTMLDGAALVLTDGIPVVALTTRHDRIDNFWFTLLHELGHIYLHFSSGLSDGFIDDDLGNVIVSDLERQADDFARSKLIPDELWKTSPVRFSRSRDAVEKFARKLNIHPAIVAGRIRSERDYSLFSELVGSGQVRKLFSVSSS